MLADIRQNELDVAEERLLTNLFGKAEIDAKTAWLLRYLNIDINEYIQNFENIVKPLMLDNGMVDVNLTKSLVASKYPLLSNIIPSTNFRLVDVVDTLAALLKGIKK